ncbi:hypothetical protein [Bradyrhizobium sp. WSM3983]|nr:hypothetical protein [Bradyrhizobium sp. WSM3983]
MLIVKTQGENAAIPMPSVVMAMLRQAILLGTYAISKACSPLA